jgi:hypothetical protein
MVFLGFLGLLGFVLHPINMALSLEENVCLVLDRKHLTGRLKS